MSAADSESAIERMAARREEHGPEDFAAYAFLALGILGFHSPETLTFLLDQADAKVGAGDA